MSSSDSLASATPNISLPSPPPPPSLSHGDSTVAEAARRRFGRRNRLGHIFSLPNLRTRSRVGVTPEPEPEPEPPIPLPANTIKLNDSALHDVHDNQDRYEWAILYENQRGMTLFSTPYYSRLSLLPNDPLPFTMPNYSLKRSKDQPLVSLTNYPLPDGRWRWVSKAWMIDMRTDAGEVQYDGFEYNWMFQRHHWRAEVGALSAGGLVRRRRWVRLMMRPAEEKVEHGHNERSHASSASIVMGGPGMPPSLGDSNTDLGRGEDTGTPLDSVWMGEDTEEDWSRCRTVLKCMGRDGRKLEVWKKWLGYYPSSHAGKATAEVPVTPVCPRREWIAAVVNKHLDAILHTLIYPDSRAELLKVFGLGLGELFVDAEVAWKRIEFWSYNSDLAEALK